VGLIGRGDVPSGRYRRATSLANSRRRVSYDCRMLRTPLLWCCPLYALLAGCVVPSPYESRSTAPNQPVGEVATVQTQPVTTPESTAPAEALPIPIPVRPRTFGAATKALVTQAQAQLNAGNESLAAATIERALRIEPDNPLLWIELAKIRHQEGNDSQAENLARKALAMASGDGKTQATAWRVIAESYRARGRNPEARDAAARANALDGSG
jgi:cytochrome c-type biogenesis protein CcmH/NrfG